MNKYIVLYHAPKSVAERFAQATPEEAAYGLKLWMDWKDKLGDNLLHLGKPLGNAMQVSKQGAKKSNTDIIGMSMLQANSMNDALEMIKGHHHLEWGEITILEEAAIPELQ